MEAAPLHNYPARISGRFGQEMTTIKNDGATLSMTVRGVEFRGTDFDSLEPVSQPDFAALNTFTLNRGNLCSCVIEAGITLPVSGPDGITSATMVMHLELGDPAPNGGIDREDLWLELHIWGKVFKSNGRSGWFEDEMLDIQKQLPANTHLRACITCAYSDYFPGGHGLFGGLACFRGNKQEYLSVRSKSDLFQLRNKLTEIVQETHLCHEFEKRQPGTGYRG